MKIAQVCPYFFPVQGGVEKHVYAVSSELARRGHEVHVFTTSTSRDSARFEHEQRLAGFAVHRYDPIWSLGEFGSFWPEFSVDILKGGYDVVHSNVFRHPHTDISAIIAKASGSGCVLTSHSPFHPAGVRLPLARGLVRFYDSLVAPFTLKMYDMVISLTPAESLLLQSLGAAPDKIVVIPNGVDSLYFDSLENTGSPKKFGFDQKRVLLYLGRINRTKGLDILIRAFQQVAFRFPDVQLAIAGPTTSPQEAEFLRELQSLVMNLGLEERVVFMGHISEEDKVGLLSSCLVLVLPSVYEPFGIVILEAGALGRPVVATRTDGPASIVREGVTGLLVQPGDALGLRDSLSRILTERGFVESMSASAKENAGSYRWEHIVDRIEDVYRKVAS